jgi:hypothetical protein
MKKAEIILAILAILALIFNLNLVPGASALTVLSLSALAVLYMYFSFALFNDVRLRNIFKKGTFSEINKMRIFGAAGAGIALAITIIGIMFKVQLWPGAELQLRMGLLALAIVTAIGLFKYLKEKSSFYLRVFKRAAVVGGLGLTLMFSSETAWLEIRYRNHPEYVEAVKKALAKPDNKELWEKVEIERKKINNEHVEQGQE